MGILSVSFDLDEIRCYHDIHGLDSPEGAQGHVVYERALPRISSFCDDLGIKATFFVVGEDLNLNKNPYWNSMILRELQGAHFCFEQKLNNFQKRMYNIYSKFK